MRIVHGLLAVGAGLVVVATSFFVVFAVGTMMIMWPIATVVSLATVAGTIVAGLALIQRRLAAREHGNGRQDADRNGASPLAGTKISDEYLRFVLGDELFDELDALKD